MLFFSFHFLFCVFISFLFFSVSIITTVCFPVFSDFYLLLSYFLHILTFFFSFPSPLYFPVMCLSKFLSDLQRQLGYTMATNILIFVFSVTRFKSVTEIQFYDSLHTLSFTANYHCIRMDRISPPQSASCLRRCVFHTTRP